MNRVVVLVWYRADPAGAEQCRRAFESLCERIAARFGIRGRLGWRDEPARGRRTWLESWEPLEAAQQPHFVEVLEDEARAGGLADLALDGRYVEVFEWVFEPCA